MPRSSTLTVVFVFVLLCAGMARILRQPEKQADATAELASQARQLEAIAKEPDPDLPCNKDGKRTVGIQVGHWYAEDVPEELDSLRFSSGASAGGYNEWELMLALGQQVRDRLERDGVAVDLLPTAIPESYCADAFLALHADGNDDTSVRGYKVSASTWGGSLSEQFATELETAYGETTGLPENDAVTDDMAEYYAFNWKRFAHAVSEETPAAILETGFLTNAKDRQFLAGRTATMAEAVSEAVEKFLDASAS